MIILSVLFFVIIAVGHRAVELEMKAVDVKTVLAERYCNFYLDFTRLAAKYDLVRAAGRPDQSTDPSKFYDVVHFADMNDTYFDN